MDRTLATSELVSLISGIKRSVHGRLYQCVGGTLNGGQVGLLVALQQESPQTPGQLAKSLYITPGAVSQITEQLLERGFLVKTYAEHNRRSYQLTLSAFGETQLADIEAQRLSFITKMTADLNDAELEALIKSYTKMLHALQNEN